MKILLLDVPGMHLGFLGFYGNDWVATPHLDRLASQAVVFDRHYAGSESDLVTGRYQFPLPGDSSSVPTNMDPTSFWNQFPEVPFQYLPPSTNSEDDPWSDMVTKILDQVEQWQVQDRCLLWAQWPSLEPPWHFPEDLLEVYFEEDSAEGPWLDPPVGFLSGDRNQELERLQNTYAAAVTFLDAQVGAVLDELEKGKVLDQWLVCFTAHSSLPLGEHSMVRHFRAWQHEESVHLPLLLRLPGAEQAGMRINTLTQPVDLLPTLMDIFHQSAPNLHGSSLMPLIREDIPEIRPYACSGKRIGDSSEWAMRTLDWAFLLPLATPQGDSVRAAQLYVKPEDRWEVNDVRQHHLEHLEQMEKTLRAFVEASRQLGSIVYPSLEETGVAEEP